MNAPEPNTGVNAVASHPSRKALYAQTEEVIAVWGDKPLDQVRQDPSDTLLARYGNNMAILGTLLRDRFVSEYGDLFARGTFEHDWATRAIKTKGNAYRAVLRAFRETGTSP